MFHGNVSLEIAEGLQVLKKRIELSKIPPSKLDETINVATWNIRDFGKRPRREAAIHYIAEIIGQFDLVAIVEVRDNLTDLMKVMPILGPYWDCVYSDAILDLGGNRERVCYVYDKRAVTFNGLAAEASPPRAKQGSEWLSKFSWWRAPYIASFKSGNFDFIAFTTHVRWGESLESRRVELENLANWIDAKIKEKNCEDKDIIVMGDFNIPSRDDALFQAITSKGLAIPKGLLKEEFGTNLARNKRYDQILHYPTYDDNFSNAGGTLNFYYGDHKPLFPDLTKDQFTYQISDHLPIWIQLKTDIDGFILDQLIQRKRD